MRVGITRPPQQFRTIDSRYNQLVHDLAPAAVRAMHEHGIAIRPTRSGPWLHSFMVSCIMASIELACLEREDISYIPQSRILARARAELRCPTCIVDPATGVTYTKDLLPDAVFGLEYHTPKGSRFRFFAVEADRATEPATSTNFHRKSFVRHLLQYENYIERGGYRDHLGLTAPMLVLNVTNDPKRMQKMLHVTAERFAQGCSYQLFQCVEEFGPIFQPSRPNPALLMGNWACEGFMDFGIDAP